jgi:H+/Cl- antiporter ClcA
MSESDRTIRKTGCASNDPSHPGSGTRRAALREWFAGYLHRVRNRPPRQLYRLWLDYGVFWIGAIIVGLCAVLYAHLIDAGYGVFRRVTGWHAWLPIVITPFIGGLSVWLTKTYFRGAEGSGIPQVIAVLHGSSNLRRSGLMGLHIAFGKIAISFLAILGGFTIGREGPTVHVGAALMFNLRCFYPKRLSAQVRADMERRLILAGAASGLAAAFNTPLAGIVFAIEELSKGFESRASGVILTAIIFSGLVALGVDGNYTYFGMIRPGPLAVEPVTIAVLLIALATGIAGGIFAWLSVNSARWMPANVVALRQRMPVAFGVLCGLVVALIGVCSGGRTFGSGYAEARGLLEGHLMLSAAYPILKLASLVASYLAGAPGGIFAPSLAIGAGIGNTMHTFMSQVSLQTAIALAMVGYMAAVTQSPITAFVIVVEMNDAHFLVIPLMATALIASTISKALAPPLYETLAQNYMGYSAAHQAVGDDESRKSRRNSEYP